MIWIAFKMYVQNVDEDIRHSTMINQSAVHVNMLLLIVYRIKTKSILASYCSERTTWGIQSILGNPLMATPVWCWDPVSLC
jgi:hypothetical protein